ncbi:hypothetical protein CYMTET_14007 [Cymbomonas tetramitiformis]|uniref:Uncharacterized protein n=1 Tax=Cymbomonas tetramitiformis TaxID=36881 RepID=A0AAE0GGW7_9CHLO|nr:hypothetical protein CYMTET_14007 [Cymbomonas tetramitiformis]
MFAFYDTAPAKRDEIIQHSGASEVAPDLFHDQKNIISKLNNSDKRFKWASHLIKIAYQHRERGSEMLVDAALKEGKLSGKWKLHFGMKLERDEGRGPRTKRGSLFSPASINAIRRGIQRAPLFDKLVGSEYRQHRQVPGQVSFGLLPMYRVNGRGSLANERVHSVWKNVVTLNMGTMMGTLILLNATCSHNATIRETLQLGNGAPNDDWWNAALCNELATELQGETRYELRLPPADNGESFFVPGLVSFTRPALHSANAKLKERAMKCIATHAARLTHNKRKELAAKRRRENRRKTLQLSDSSGMQLDDTAPEGKGKGILYGPAPPPDVGTGSMPLLTATPQADMASASSAGTGSMPLLTATPQADMANASSADARKYVFD